MSYNKVLQEYRRSPYPQLPESQRVWLEQELKKIESTNLSYYEALKEVEPYTDGGFVNGPSSSVNGHVVTFSGTTGKLLADSGVSLSSLATTSSVTTALAPYVVGPSSSTNNAFALFDGTTGKLLKNSSSFIDSSGNIQFGTSSTYASSYRISVAPPSGASGGLIFKNNGSSCVPYAFMNTSGSVVGYIGTNDTATAYVTSSDYRLKENVQPMQNALAKVAQLNPVTYTWKSNGASGQGFIAHELQQVVPECVVGTKDAVDAQGNPVYQGIDASFLIATLTKAIQELTARVAALEAN